MAEFEQKRKIYFSVDKRQISSFLTLNELNQKLLKLDYKFDCKRIEFLKTLVYIDLQNKPQTILLRKSSDRQNFIKGKSEHPYSLKKSIPYSEALRIRRICSTLQDYHSHSRKLIEQFVDKEYKDLVIQQIQKLTNSIENNCSTNKNVMIYNVYHYQQHIVEHYQIQKIL